MITDDDVVKARTKAQFFRSSLGLGSPIYFYYRTGGDDETGEIYVVMSTVVGGAYEIDLQIYPAAMYIEGQRVARLLFDRETGFCDVRAVDANDRTLARGRLDYL